jgi:16S rRNA (cytosine1402-N4)-methyltransferase
MNALQHTTVMLEEAIAALQIEPDGIYLDATFGMGGHSRGILERLSPRGRLIVLDRDPLAIAAAERLGDARIDAAQVAFAGMREVTAQLGVAKLDGVLLDLGVSSPQLDDAARGFSFRSDGPLDMRMDPTRGTSAARWLAEAEEAELSEVIKKYGEERFAKQIARAIVAARQINPITTTRQLAGIAASAVRTREAGQDPATRTFQAIRIHINQELEELALALPQAVDLLAQGGRLAVISFHSLEDRIVKRFMRAQCKRPDVPPGLGIRESELPLPRLRPVGKPLRPGAAEVGRNRRSRSATLRVAERTEAP